MVVVTSLLAIPENAIWVNKVIDYRKNGTPHLRVIYRCLHLYLVHT